MFVPIGGRDARVPNEFVTSCSRWAVSSKSSRIRRFSHSRPASSGGFSACACAMYASSICSMRARRLYPRRYPLAGVHGPPHGDPEAGLGARGGGGVVRLLVDELVDPELECLLLTALVILIRPIYRRDMRFLFDFSNDSSISTWIVATIGACRGCGGGDSLACQHVYRIGYRRCRAGLLAACDGHWALAAIIFECI